MKTLLMLLTLLPLSAAAKETPAFDQAQECADGKCWRKGGPDGAVVTVPKSGGPRPNLTNGEPKKFKIDGKKTPKPETKSEKSNSSGGGEEGFLSKAWKTLKPAAGMLAGAGIGAVVGGLMGGFPGALFGAAIGAVGGLFVQMFISSKIGGGSGGK